MGKRKLPVQKLKYCLEHLWSWIAVIWLRFRWEPQRRYMSVSWHVGRTARHNQKIHFLYRTCSNSNPNPPSPQKEKQKNSVPRTTWQRRAEHKEQGILEEGTKNKGKAMSPELKQKFVELYEKDENSRIIPGNKGKWGCAWQAWWKNPRVLSKNTLFFVQCSDFFTRWFETSNSFIVLSAVVKGDWVKIWTYTIHEVDLCILLAVLPTWHKTNINLCRSLLMLRQMTSLQLHRSSQYNISVSVLPF